MNNIKFHPIRAALMPRIDSLIDILTPQSESFHSPESHTHKVLTYVECRVLSGAFQNIDPPPFPPSECVLPPHQRRGVHTRRAVRGWWVNILEDARHWIGLLQYNLCTLTP